MGLEDWVASQRERRLALSSGASVFEDVKSVDLVLAGNSSVLIDAVTAGRPSGYLADLDHGPNHPFVERDLIYSMQDESGSFRWNPDSMLRFYQRPGWLNILREFANIDEDENTVGMRMAAKLRQFAADGSLHPSV